MNANFEIRPAIPGDAADIARLIADGGADAHLNPALGVDEAYIESCRRNGLSDEQVRVWHNRIDEQLPEHHLTVAVNSLRHVVGTHYSRREGEQRGSILACYVDRDYRDGGMSGVAQQLTEGALAWVGGHRTIDVMIATYNTRSQRFHWRNGFTIAGEKRFMGRIPTQLWLRPAREEEV